MLSIHKVELESQILCAALRQSWAASDAPAAALSVRELSELFPDLLPQGQVNLECLPLNLYEVLSISPQSPQAQVISAYMRKVRKFLSRLRKSGTTVTANQDDYWQTLNAGFILRKPRLRVSHDLIAARFWLTECKLMSAEGKFIRTLAEEKQKPELPPEKPQEAALPLLIDMLFQARLIGEAEVQALKAQMARAPEIPLERLILDSGYVSRQEMNSLKLAETLLGQKKINMAQFQVAMYDERNSGVRMAESLQVRGWLPIEIKPDSPL